jgi:5'-3' exonuclease
MANFFQETSYESGRAFLEGKAMQGDTSDSIPPVGGIGGKGAAVLLAQYKSVQGLFDAVQGGHVPDAPRYKKAFATFAASEEARANFDRNMKLMNLIDAQMVPTPAGSAPLLNPGSYNPESVQVLFGRLGFVSLLKDYDNWVRPFAPATTNEEITA